MIVNLTPQNMVTAALVGARRQCAAIVRDLKHFGHRKNSKTLAFDHHCIGAMAEFAVAKQFNLFWDDNVGRTDGSDVGGILEVRARRPEVGLDLAIRPRDAGSKPYVLVYARPPEFEIVGWAFASDGKRLGKWNDASSLYYVPPASLQSVDDLRDLVAREREFTRAAE
jgi:hypothetical protein